VMGMLIVHSIGDGRLRGRLLTARKSYRGGPVRCGGREKNWPWECGCGNIRRSVLGAPGCASS
jgi:hypothetical protein